MITEHPYFNSFFYWKYYKFFVSKRMRYKYFEKNNLPIKFLVFFFFWRLEVWKVNQFFFFFFFFVYICMYIGFWIICFWQSNSNFYEWGSEDTLGFLFFMLLFFFFIFLFICFLWGKKYCFFWYSTLNLFYFILLIHLQIYKFSDGFEIMLLVVVINIFLFSVNQGSCIIRIFRKCSS